MPAETSSFFSTANYIETGVWIVIGLVFAIQTLRSRTSPVRRTCAFAAVVFIAFGVSDVVEVQTGAWWRPWWLFVWKAGCVLGMLGLLVQYLRGRQAGGT